MFGWIITGLGMVAVGWLVWSMLQTQGPATPPDDERRPSDGRR
jgi:hypothetical protein